MTDRRRVLQAGLVWTAVLTLPACSSNGAQPPASPPEPDPDQADELALIAAYDAVLQSGETPFEQELRRIRDEHAAHLRALGWNQPSASAAAPTAPLGRRALQRAERQAARLRTRAAAIAEDPERAQILALIAASEAQHAATLESR